MHSIRGFRLSVCIRAELIHSRFFENPPAFQELLKEESAEVAMTASIVEILSTTEVYQPVYKPRTVERLPPSRPSTAVAKQPGAESLFGIPVLQGVVFLGDQSSFAFTTAYVLGFYDAYAFSPLTVDFSSTPGETWPTATLVVCNSVESHCISPPLRVTVPTMQFCGEKMMSYVRLFIAILFDNVRRQASNDPQLRQLLDASSFTHSNFTDRQAGNLPPVFKSALLSASAVLLDALYKTL